MGYFWNCEDNDAAVTTGANAALTWGGVIQRNDGLGGYNTQFNVPNSVAHYHVHFGAGSVQVTTVRYFGGGGGQGNNVVTYNPGNGGYGPAQRTNVQGLAHWLTQQQHYPNHVALMNNLRNAIPAGRVAGEIQ